MTESESKTAYCGLYCSDCIPSNRAFFESVRALQRQLEELGFEHYATLKKNNVALRNYNVFATVLDEIARMQCSGPCREGGGNSACHVRTCCVSKGYAGCWECAGFRECDLLQPLRDFHGENIIDNLEMIRRYGPAEWSERRGKHYPWSS
jgi:hypothetical protein